MTERRDTTSGRVLVVEDDRLLARSVARVLGGYFSTAIAHSVGEALRVLGSDREVTSMIVDVRLPDGNGLDLAGEVRRAERSLPIIVMTGHGSPAVSLRALELRAWLLLKPLDKDQLEAICECLGSMQGQGQGWGYGHGQGQGSRTDRGSGRGRGLDGGVAVDVRASRLEQVELRGLTRRQEEVLRLAVAGHDRRSMCERLQVSNSTLKSHVRAILTRCEARRLNEVVRRARGVGGG